MSLLLQHNVITWDSAINCLQDPLEFGFSVNVQPSCISSISSASGNSVGEPVTKGPLRLAAGKINYNFLLAVALLRRVQILA